MNTAGGKEGLVYEKDLKRFASAGKALAFPYQGGSAPRARQTSSYGEVRPCQLGNQWLAFLEPDQLIIGNRQALFLEVLVGVKIPQIEFRAQNVPRGEHPC